MMTEIIKGLNAFIGLNFSMTWICVLFQYHAILARKNSMQR